MNEDEFLTDDTAGIVATAAGFLDGPGRLSQDWLKRRGMRAVVLPDYPSLDIGEHIAAWLQKKNVATCCACFLGPNHPPHDPTSFRPTAEAFALLGSRYPGGNAIAFSEPAGFALYLWEMLCFVVAGPADELSEIIGMSINEAHAEMRAELAQESEGFRFAVGDVLDYYEHSA